jgi:glutathione S-transferase
MFDMFNFKEIGTLSSSSSSSSSSNKDKVAKQLQIVNELKSSTEPKRFSAPPQQIPSLMIASLPVLFRLGSGIFANGYQVSIKTMNKSMNKSMNNRQSEYTVLSLFDKYQIKETCVAGRTSQVEDKLEPLVLYEFEQCPFCRKVREAVSILGLTVTFKPCPPKGRIYRPEIKDQFGPKATFPFLQDPNTGIQMFESDAIIDYLFRTYGSEGPTIPWTLNSNNPLVPISAALGLLLGGGGTTRNSNPPTTRIDTNGATNGATTNTNIELWSYEGSPFCKLVKERLCELEIAHTQISCPRGSPNRQRMFDQTGRFQAPYLTDANTDTDTEGGVALWESAAIIEYLQKVYGIADSPIKYL